jgi:thioredoxin 1
MSKLIEITDATFEVEVLQSPVPVLVDFFGTYCGPCKLLKPVLVALAESLSDTAKVATVDIQENERLTHDFKIEVVPTLIVFDGGKPIQRMVGLQNMHLLREALGV